MKKQVKEVITAYFEYTKERELIGFEAYKAQRLIAAMENLKRAYLKEEKARKKFRKLLGR